VVDAAELDTDQRFKPASLAAELDNELENIALTETAEDDIDTCSPGLIINLK
jgi:pilus assembly protein FimV